MKKVLIIGGVHGDETTGIEVAKYFLNNSYPGVRSLIANPEAVKKNKRFLETDLNRSFNSNLALSREEKIARNIQEKGFKEEIVIDIHNTTASGTTCAIVTKYPNNKLISLSKYFGFNNLVIMPGSNSLISLNPDRSISLEISYVDSETGNFSFKNIIEKIKDLDKLNVDLDSKVNIYEYLSSINPLTIERLGLKRSVIKNFKELTYFQKKTLRVDVSLELFPIFAKKGLIDGFSIVRRIA